MSSSDDGCVKAIGGLILVFAGVGCLFGVVIPFVVGVVGSVVGFLGGFLVWAGLITLVGLAATLLGLAVHHGICWGLRHTSDHSMTPGQQVCWAIVPAMVSAVVVLGFSFETIDENRTKQVADAETTTAEAQDETLGEIMSHGMAKGGWGGARVGFWAGVVLGSGLFLWLTIGTVSQTHNWAEQIYLTRIQPTAATASAGPTSGYSTGSYTASPPPQSSTQTQTPPPSSASTQSSSTPPSSSQGKTNTSSKHVKSMVDAAVLELEKIDKKISQITVGLVENDGLVWPKLAQELRQAADIYVLAHQAIQATQDLVDHHRAVADEDLRELQEALKRDQDAEGVLGEMKQMLESMKAPVGEIEEVDDLYDEVGVLHLDLLPGRQWADHRDGFDAMPEAISELSCFQRAASDLGFNDVADVTAATLKKAVWRLSAMTHTDKNKNTGSQDHFVRVQHAKELLIYYLNTLGKTA